MRFLSRRSLRPLAAADGLTLIEVLVALGLVVVMMSAVLTVTMSSYRASRETRWFQQATGLANESIEEMRDVSFQSLAMRSDATDTAIVACGGFAKAFDPDAGGPLACEAVVSSSVSTLPQHRTTISVDGKTFTRARFVTWVDHVTQGGAQQSYKRVTAVVTWTSGSRTRSYRTSTMMTEARRGLPTPKFTLAPPAQTIEVQAQLAQQVYADFIHTVKNEGVRDTIDLLMCTTDPPCASTSMPALWSVAFYRDLGQIGLYEDGVDELLTDTNATGVPDTGTLETGSTLNLIARVSLAPTEPSADRTLTLTGRSGIDPAQRRSVRDTVVRGGLKLYLKNATTLGAPPPNANTTARKNMVMEESPVPSAATLYNYSATGPGRHIKTYPNDTITISEPSTEYMANWVRQIGTGGTFTGDAKIKIWVAQKDLKCDKEIRFRVYLREKASATGDTVGTGGEELASADVTRPALAGITCDFLPFEVTLPITNKTIAANNWLEVRIFVRKSSGDEGLVAYDTSAFPSVLTLPAGVL